VSLQVLGDDKDIFAHDFSFYRWLSSSGRFSQSVSKPPLFL
jgi:hypothetical protein